MPEIVIHVEGEEETVRKIGMFEMDKKKKGAKIVRKYANRVRKGALEKVPVSPSNRKKSHGSPGDLKSSIRTKYYFEGLGAMVMPANPKGSHRNLVEYGTKRRSNKAGQNRGKAPMQPFMIPSRAENNAAYNAEMKQLFEGGEDTTV